MLHHLRLPLALFACLGLLHSPPDALPLLTALTVAASHMLSATPSSVRRGENEAASW